MDFVLIGRFKPAVRMTQRSKFADPQAQEYLASKMVLGLQFNQQMALNEWEMLPGQTPLALDIEIISRDGHRSDLSNQLKALEDAAQGIVFANDCWIDTITVRRQEGERYETRVRVELDGKRKV